MFDLFQLHRGLSFLGLRFSVIIVLLVEYSVILKFLILILVKGEWSVISSVVWS